MPPTRQPHVLLAAANDRASNVQPRTRWIAAMTNGFAKDGLSPKTLPGACRRALRCRNGAMPNWMRCLLHMSWPGCRRECAARHPLAAAQPARRHADAGSPPATGPAVGLGRPRQLLRLALPGRLLAGRCRRTAQRRRGRTGRRQPVAGGAAGPRPCRARLPAGDTAVATTCVGAGWHQAHHQLPARTELAACAAGRGTRRIR